MEGSVLSFLQAEGKVSNTGSVLTEPLVLLAIVLSVLLRFTDSDCPFDIFKLFLSNPHRSKRLYHVDDDL
jgi:hypothetical protein